MRRRLVVGLTGAALAAVLVLLGGALAARPVDATHLPATRPTAADHLLGGFSAGDTAATVSRLEAQIAAGQGGVKTLVLLGLAYQQRARETGDPGFYEPSERALRRAFRMEPRNHLALAGLAALAASRHRFGAAGTFAKRALAVNPYSSAAWGILGDAELETGHYRSAFTAFERMVSIRPTTAAYARISYARELLGRTRPAIRAMRQAAAAAAASPGPAAWALTHLGNLFAGTGRLAVAERHYRHALAYVRAYAPALAALARLEFWRGNSEGSVRLWQAALEAQELPEYAVGLGDALSRLELHPEAEKAYARARALEADFAAAGGHNQLETALFDLDHGRDLAGALVRARIGQRLRPSVEGEHVLAWALYKNGHCREARVHSVRALRLGTKDWGAMLHRSLIESCLGHAKTARLFRERALAVTPYALAAFGPLASHRGRR
jgi:tetratricopeptide (TPR) repeat protein